MRFEHRRWLKVRRCLRFSDERQGGSFHGEKHVLQTEE
jgi:hypothetical protein